jgi:small subunit ribosomal protein S13
VARIVGIDIPDNKHIEISLTYIFGIGRSMAKSICRKANVPFGTRTRDLTEEQTVRIRDIIENEHKVEGALRSEVTMNIKRLMEIGSYRGMRHKMGLPVRGQRTHTNARTRKGPRNRPGAKRKKTAA